MTAAQMTISALRKAYLEGRQTPRQIMQQIRLSATDFVDRNIWIHLLSEEEQRPYLAALEQKDINSAPLWGIPFAIKDNIDLAGIRTTAACPEFAYTADESAFVVQKLIDAGAIPVGKTNLDQFATGLNGTRSPYGPGKNAFDSDYISGGSSAGSALSVALGLASFSLGTDTAGSGRVPAGFNNLVGVKPTRGILSGSGMLPACRSLDTISLFALNTDDANLVLSQVDRFDASDCYSRINPFNNSAHYYGLRSRSLKVGVIAESQLKFFGDPTYERAYIETLEKLKSASIELVAIDYTPFNEAALLLYEGPWVAERYIACQPMMEENPQAIHPVVRSIIEPGRSFKAVELFEAEYRLQGLKRQSELQMNGLDCLLTPTAGKLFRIDELYQEPTVYNAWLGYYTNYMNLLDMAAVALPATFTETGLPFGITLAGKAFSDRKLLSIANRLQQLLELPLGTDAIKPETASSSYRSMNMNRVDDTDLIELLVCGAHLEGLPLNWQLTERGAVLKERTRTAPSYRIYALAEGPQKRPGMIRDEEKGTGIDVEVWTMPASEFGGFVAGIPAPLGIGQVELASGRWVSGFICENYGLDGALEITAYGGWRSWLEARSED